MTRLSLRRALALALVFGGCLTGLAGPTGAGAAGQRGTPPTGFNLARPTVAGILVAKPVGGEASQPVRCGKQDRTAPAPALQVNRGLVICSNAKKLVLLQLSPGTRITDRTWDTLSIDRMTVGDRVRAWGSLKAGGAVLDPTALVEDVSLPRDQFQTVAGTLIAKPTGGNQSIICQDQDRTAQARALVPRGLVICTREARLILLELSTDTKIVGLDGSKAVVADLTNGDRIVARGRLIDNGIVLSPTLVVRDSDIQTRATASQDFIAARDVSLTLYVLKSDGGGPVQGVVHALRGNDTRVVLCEGQTGNWSDLNTGKTIDVSASIFNRRTMTYVDTGLVKVASCT